MSDGPYDRYTALCAAGELSPDPVQESVIARLQALASALAAPGREPRGLLDRLLSRDEPVTGPRGIYLHGGVGRGKSMLMDR